MAVFEGRVACRFAQPLPADSRGTFDRKAVSGNVWVGRLGLENSNSFANSGRFETSGGHKKDKGDRAVLLQCQGNLDAIQEAGLKLQAPLDLKPSCFGENIFVESSSFRAESICVGDEFQCWRQGQPQPLRFQVASPRCPCSKVDMRLGRTFSEQGVRFHCAQTGRAGCFLRVLEEGDLCDGDLLRLSKRPNPSWTVARVSGLLYGHDEAAKHYLQRSKLAVADFDTPTVRREEFMGTQEELEELAALPELATFEWKEHLVRMLGRHIGRYRKRRMSVAPVAVLGLAVLLGLFALSRRKSKQ
ncbi:unnamed protein product [Effrenium voratum]|uniref:MOSC domain-containing protein n=1 Tax=Effrenium voratum TaxID=2562239 RepID=A0AA36J3V2_9DINO|nr:unnamed protein product [Effrenium voratum]